MPSSLTRRTVSATPVALALLVVAAVLATAPGCGASDAGNGEPAPDATPVTVVVPEREAVTDELRLSGTLEAVRSARLSARMDGLVASVGVDAGDAVDAGDLLLHLDDTLARQALARARAGTVLARARVGEAQRLVEEARRLTAERHLPQTELARRESELDLATAELAMGQATEREAAEHVERHSLPAPFDGVVARKATEAGEWVTRGTTVLELVSLEQVRLDVRVPQERFAAIADDSPVEIRPDALPGETLPARIVARVPVGDADARSFLVRLLIDAPGRRLLPGTSASATFRLSTDGRSAPLVPRDALLRHPDGGYSLFAVVEGENGPVAQRRTVVPGRESGSRVQILDGLQDGDRVVIRGNETLREGQAVRLVERPGDDDPTGAG